MSPEKSVTNYTLKRKEEVTSEVEETDTKEAKGRNNVGTWKERKKEKKLFCVICAVLTESNLFFCPWIP